MAPLTHACPTDDFELVRAVVEAELGCPLESVFSSFAVRPLASASLAQVHEATLRSTGARVAVKVQHPGLRETAQADIETISLLVNVAKRLFPKADYVWLADEIRVSLPRELDFTQEAANCEGSARAFAGRPQVRVPGVHREYTTPRMLTMSFEEGVYVNRLQDIKQMNVDPTAVAKLVSEIFCDQIFIQGSCHCDPHAGNLLVRPLRDAEGKPVMGSGGKFLPQVVLLDHGLYRHLTTDLRLNYAKLWRAILRGDEPGIKRYSAAMNAGEMYQLWAAILTTRSWDKIVAVADSGDTETLRFTGSAEQKKETAENAKQYTDEISEILRKIPRELLLILKTNDCLRSVDLALGAPVNNLVITARTCQRAINEERSDLAPGVGTSLANLYDNVSLEFRIGALRAVLSTLRYFVPFLKASPSTLAAVQPVTPPHKAA
jgi:aarF domain-containing kinase